MSESSPARSTRLDLVHAAAVDEDDAVSANKQL
jgi:hypothetical protein